jgi:hypothetical protein
MVTELTRFSVKTEEDILHLHKLCMDPGVWAGLPVPDSIRFAAGIATHSNPFNSEVIQVCFSIDEKENQSCLLAKIQNHSRNIETRIGNAIKYSSSHRPLRITVPGLIFCSGIINFRPDSYFYLTKLLKSSNGLLFVQ